MTDKAIAESIESATSDSTTDSTPDNREGTEARSGDAGPGSVPPTVTRIVLQTIVVALAASAGGFGGGYFFTERAALRERDQVANQERIDALEAELAQLRESSDRMQLVELDLTDVLEPIREAVAHVALVKLTAISEEITTELANVVAVDLADPSVPSSRAALDPRSADPTTMLLTEPREDQVGLPAGPLGGMRGHAVVANTMDAVDAVDAILGEEPTLLDPVLAPPHAGATAEIVERDAPVDAGSLQTDSDSGALAGETVSERQDLVTSPDTETNSLGIDADTNDVARGLSSMATESAEPAAESDVGDDAAGATLDRPDDPPISESSSR